MRIRTLAFFFALTTGSTALIGCNDAPVIPPLPDGGPPTPTDGGPAEAMCDNGVRDGDESALDCGGSCPACPDGSSCSSPDDCASGVCSRGFCLVPSCSDGVQNGPEIGVDCGGECGLCPGGQPCTAPSDCLSGRCRMSVCAASSCEDGNLNGDETDVDCGGPLCPACAGGEACGDGDDCESLICASGVCTSPACNDRVQNGAETSVDCGGGVCPACGDGLACMIDADCASTRCVDGGCVACDDGIQNGDESDVDCGGIECGACADGLACVVDGDCVNSDCNAGVCESCSDGVQNRDETDADCGGTLCSACADRLTCVLDVDCVSGDCNAGVCESCADGVQNRDETDADCGGTICATCGTGLMCAGDADCASMICDAPTGRCNAPGCGDGILNGDETDLDCGGGSCLPCDVGDVCLVGRDCVHGVCDAGLCVDATCSDGVTNGGETDVDCGGASSGCPRCPDYDVCTDPSDCATGACTMGRCGTTGCVPFPGTSTDAFGYFGCTIPLTPSTLPCPDISSTGTSLSLGDDGEASIPIGFSFDYYGTARTTTVVGSNGAVIFDTMSLPYTNACFPRSSTPYEMIAPWWDDLYPPSGGTVKYETVGTAPNRMLVVRWNLPHISASGGTDLADFSVVLHEGTSHIDMCYVDTTMGANDNGSSATVGLSAMSDSLQFSCNTASLSPGLLIQFRHP